MSILNMLYGSGSGGYAIYDLSLTNDDTNEQVIVKWFEYMPANWVKTVVRYKTGSAPVSPTDGTLAVEETTKNQYSSTGYGVSGLSDNTTYYFSVFAIDSNGTIINVQNGMIKTEFDWKPTANTLLHFPLINNAVDSVNSVNLTSYSSTSYTTIGGVKSAEFTKSNWLYNNSVSVIPQGDVEKTFSVWAYIKGGNTLWQGFVQAGNSGAGNVFGLGLYSGKYTVVMTRWGSTSNEYTPTLNKWTNFIATYKNSVWKLYVDGTLQVTWNASAPTNGNVFNIGQNIGETRTGGTFYGNISNVILENKEWTLADVQSYYNKAKKHYS